MPYQDPLSREMRNEKMNTIVYAGEVAGTHEVPWHSHDQWELVCCTGGKGTFQFENGGAIDYNKGDTVAIPPGTRHRNISAQGFTNLHLRMWDPPFPFRCPFRVENREGNPIEHALREANRCFRSDSSGNRIVLTALGELIASYVIACRSDGELSRPVEKIRGLIDSNFSDCDFALDEAIRAIPFHYDYLRKQFRKEIGLTPLAYMTRLRMQRAEKLLSAMGSSDYTVAQISRLCGFEDPLYFSRVFRKHFGCSPSAFAKSHENRRSINLED